MEHQHEAIKKSLFQFINAHIKGADLRIVDEIVLSYVISVLEEAAQDETYEVEEFIDMMSAYFPEFAQIPSSTVFNWIIDLNIQLVKLSATPAAQSLSLNSLSLTELIPEDKLCGRRISETADSEAATGEKQQQLSNKRTQHLSETGSDGGSTDSSSCDLFSEECDILQEMFPETCFIEVKHCVTVANGDINKATQLLLHRQEMGESLHQNPLNKSNRQPALNDHDMKNRIIARYSYVDKVDTREYKPVIPKVEPKVRK